MASTCLRRFFGTLTFSVMDGKPHLRIFANQELSELQKETDFIAPQAIWMPGHIYDHAKIGKNPFGVIDDSKINPAWQT